MEELAQRLESGLTNLKAQIEADQAGHASTMLHYYRRRLDELVTQRRFLFELGKISLDTVEWLEELERPIREELKRRLDARITWIADRIQDTIDARTKAGRYQGEFTTAVILANAYNDILEYDFGKFQGDK